ncbi:hypothetical protein FCN77_17820 [Arthrobacter sp. 24S4-2]|uniref:hypothetical protein n=1 Tax=Arthrobacter sp. 24S4-2 TaxID=2575374 RepID=UPI0010C78C9B|nr:hypothetical protein [Arthrobacter sp. 24S4-2]QCO99215.1 hypothetical protein FCN77_17820 [Arthrobacter sp. 24S4-2]
MTGALATPKPGPESGTTPADVRVAMFAGPNILVLVHADVGAAMAGPDDMLPDGTREAPFVAVASAEGAGDVAPVPGTAGAAVPGRTEGGAAGVPEGAGVPAGWVGSADGAVPPLEGPPLEGDGAGVDGGAVPPDGVPPSEGVGDGEAQSGSVVGVGEGDGGVRRPGGVGSPVSEGSGLGARTTDAQASSNGTPAWTVAVVSPPSDVVSGAGTRDTAWDAGTPAERTSTAPSAAAAVPRRRPPWKPVSVRVSSDF